MMLKRVTLGVALLALVLGGSAAAGKVAPDSREQITLSFAPVVKKVAPAVVNIYTRKIIEQRASPLFSDPFFSRFFGQNFFGGAPERKVQNSLGSGVIVGGEGTVVTNYHVVKGADQITVVLSDRREFEAKPIGTDERADIAVLRINVPNERLPALEFGDSDAAEVGDLVLAIGDPFGVGQTVTSGIISALARTGLGINDFNFFIQTDAAINPGNSGGALVTMDGKLIGVNTAIYSGSGGSIGIGFAVPSNMVRTVVRGILAGGKLVRPWFGAQGETVNAEAASSLGLPRPMGVLISDVFKEGPAAAAGLKTGDVILRIDGREVDDAESLRYRIATKPLNGKAELTVYRQGHELMLPISLTPPPETVPRDAARLAVGSPLAGATVMNLSPAVADEYGLNPFQKGVVVTSVAADTPAANLGVKLGDVILRINGADTRTVEEVRTVLKRPANAWQLSLRRGERVLNVVVSN